MPQTIPPADERASTGAFAPYAPPVPRGVAVDPAPTSDAGAERARGRFDVLFVVLGGLLFYGLNVDFMLRGDAAMYADYVLLSKFDELSLHIGYYAVLWVADRVLGAVGIPIQETSVWLNVACTAATLGVSYLLARDLLGSRRTGLLVVVVLAACGRVTMNATTSEVYALQTLLVLSSFLLFGRSRVVAAGLAAGGALLVSPLSAFAFLFHPVLDWQRTRAVRWRVWLRLAGGAALVYLPYLAVLGRELFWGRRGLLDINDAVALDLAATLTRVPLYQFKHYTFLLLLLLPALWAVREHRRFLALTLAVVVPHLYIVMKLTSEDNVFLLNTDFFLACWLVLGWRQLEKTRLGRWIAPAPLVAHVALLLAAGSLFAFQNNRAYAGELRSIARDLVAGRDATVVSDWDGGMSLTFFGRERPVSTIERDPLYLHQYDIGEVRTEDPAKLRRADLYLLETWSAGGLRRLLSSPESQAEMARRSTVRARARRLLGLECGTLVRAGIHPLYRCTLPAASFARPAR